MKVYIVEMGDGNEWDEIAGVFSTVEKAKKWAEHDADANPESDGPPVWDDYSWDGVVVSSAPDWDRRYSVMEFELDAS